MTRKHALAGWIVDDTGFPKKGTHSVGVVRQYCGQLGKQDNCRVAVSVSLATEEASIPAAYRLYLPETWANDGERRKTTVGSGRDSYHWNFAMRLASSLRPHFGLRASCRCRPGRREK